MPDITPGKNEPIPQKPEMVDVLLINGQLTSGHTFDYAIREDLGDSFTDGEDFLVMKNGSNGQVIRIARAQVALLSLVTRQMPKDLPKISPSKSDQSA